MYKRSYKKKTYAKKRPTYKRTYKPKRRTYTRTKRIVKQVIRQQAETKHKEQELDFYINTNGFNGTVPSAFGIYAFPIPTQGTDDINRIGNQIFVKSLQCKWFYYGSAGRLVRIIVFKWLSQINATTTEPDIQSVLENLQDSAPQNINCLYKKDTKQFKIMYDRVFNTRDQTLLTGHIKLIINNKIDIIGDSVFKPWYYIFGISSDLPAGVPTGGNFNGQTRINYIDV